MMDIHKQRTQTKSVRGATVVQWQKVYMLFCFFFSSTRRHTRLTCDWSSDLCSSDLHRTPAGGRTQQSHQARRISRPRRGAGIAPAPHRGRTRPRNRVGREDLETSVGKQKVKKIGRASCRERVENYEEAVCEERREMG